MPLFRKKATIVDAVQFLHVVDGDPVFAGEHQPWVGEALMKERGTDGALYVTANGVLMGFTTRFVATVLPGDWIVREMPEFFVVPADLFEATYEPA